MRHFDDTVDIVDSVIVDHNTSSSEDEARSVTSTDEVTYERWTEETRLIKTHVLDSQGNIVDELYEAVNQPELVGNILREKLIERHEHSKREKRVSQEGLKRVRVKEARSQSLDLRMKANKTYFIQHQQIISPVDVAPKPVASSSASLSSSSWPNYHLTPLIYSSKSKSLSRLLEEDLSLVDSGHINPELPTDEIVDVANKRFLVQNHFRIQDGSESSENATDQTESICFLSTNLPHLHRNSCLAITSSSPDDKYLTTNPVTNLNADLNMCKEAAEQELDQDKTTSDSLESMGRFRRPTKLEMIKLQRDCNREARREVDVEVEEREAEVRKLISCSE